MEMIQLISFYCMDTEEKNMKLMCARGLMMLMQLDKLNELSWLEVSFELCKVLNSIYQSEPGVLVASDDPLMEFLKSITKARMIQHVVIMQSLITLQVVTEDINLEHLEETVKVLDLFYSVNKLKPLDD